MCKKLMNNSDLSQWMEAYPGPVLFLSIVAKSRYLAYGAWCVYVRVPGANIHTVLPIHSKNQYSAEEHVWGIQTQADNNL